MENTRFHFREAWKQRHDSIHAKMRVVRILSILKEDRRYSR